MQIVIGADHGGFDAKAELIEHLKGQNHRLVDVGTHTKASCDYPDIAADLVGTVQQQGCFGVLICGTGVGVSLSANRFRGIRAAVIHDAFSARMAREHNDANVICFGAQIISVAAMIRHLEIFLSTEFAGGRHQRRVDKILGLGESKLLRTDEETRGGLLENGA